MAGIKERLIQVILRGKDLLSPEAKKSRGALDDLRNAGEKLREELDKAKEQNNLVRSLTALEKESERAERTAERTTKQAEDLRAELDKSPDSKGLSRSLTIAEREAAKAQLALDRLKQETVDYAAKAKTAGIDTSKLSDEEKRLAAELDKAKRSVDSNTKSTKSLEREQRQAARAAAEHGSRTTSLGNALKSAEKKVLGYAAAYISLRAATNLASKALGLVRSGIESVISVGDDAEKSKIQLEGLMGSIAGGEQATAWIEEFADKSGQRINDVREAFADLKAYGLDPMDGSMQAIMDTTAQLGGETEKLKGISLGIGQMWAKEKIVQEEVNQLRERGVNVYALLSKAMNKSVGELQDMAAAGELGRTEVKLLLDEMGRSASGQAARSIETLSGKWNVLQNQFQKFGEQVASHGAMDVVKEKLQGVLDKVIEFSDDGTLDNLAESLSTAFVAGIEKVEEFIGTLAKVDFKTLTDDSANWLNNFSQNVDDAMLRMKLFIAPFRTLFNGITSGISTLALGFLQQVDLILAGVEKVSEAMPDALGGAKLKQSIEDARSVIAGFSEGLVAQIVQDGADIRASWEMNANSAVDQKKREVDAVQAAELAKQKAQADTSAAIIAMLDAEVDAGRTAAIEGRRNLEDLADALNVIDATDSVAELEKLRSALLKAYQDGLISMQEYEQATGVLNGKIREVGRAGQEAAKDLSTLDGVMKAIAKSANSIDTSQALAALNKLYREGAISSDELKKGQQAVNDKVAELKGVSEDTAKAFKGSQEDMRREIGKTMVEERNAIGERIVNQRKLSGAIDDTGDAADGAAVSMNFFDEVLGRARTPLAEMSAAALQAFDDLQGIKTPTSIDTSSISSVTDALNESRQAANNYAAELGAMGSRATGFGIWAMETLERSEKIKASWLGQKASLLSLMDTVDKGGLSLKYLSEMAGNASSRFDLLSEADLGPMIAAANQARAAMQAFSESTESTVGNLRMELLQLQGTEEEIARARAQQRRDDLAAQLAIAEKNQDQESINRLHEAFDLLNKIESEQVNRIRTTAEEKAAEAQRKEKEAQQKVAESAQREADNERKRIESEQQAKARELEREKAAKASAKEKDSASRPVVGQQYQQPAAGSPIVTRVIRIESRNGQGVDLGIRSASDEIQLLSVLEAAGLRSL